MKQFSTIIQSAVTEKSSSQQSKGQYSFIVKRNASKLDIKKAVKAIFGADVETVRTMLTPKKTRLLRGRHEWIKRPVLKKAIITLKNNATIDPNKVQPAKAAKAKAKKAKSNLKSNNGT